jgi:hypothetical protein
MKHYLAALAALALTACGTPVANVPVADHPTYQLAAIRSLPLAYGDYQQHRKAEGTGKYGLELDNVAVDGLRGVAGPHLGFEHGDKPTEQQRAKVIMDRDTGRVMLLLEPDSAAANLMARWFKTVLDGKVERKSISIIFHNDAGEEAGRVTLVDAEPTHYSADGTARVQLKFLRMEMK